MADIDQIKEDSVQVKRYVRRQKGGGVDGASGIDGAGASVAVGAGGYGASAALGVGGSGRPKQCEYEYSCMVSVWPKLRDGDEEKFEEVRVAFGRRGLESYNWNR